MRTGAGQTTKFLEAGPMALPRHELFSTPPGHRKEKTMCKSTFDMCKIELYTIWHNDRGTMIERFKHKGLRQIFRGQHGQGRERRACAQAPADFGRAAGGGNDRSTATADFRSASIE